MTRVQLLGCLVALAGVFAACILVVGSRDAQMSTALLLIAAVMLGIPTVRRAVRRIQQAGVTTFLRNARTELTLHEDAPHILKGDRSSLDRPKVNQSGQ